MISLCNELLGLLLSLVQGQVDLLLGLNLLPHHSLSILVLVLFSLSDLLILLPPLVLGLGVDLLGIVPGELEIGNLDKFIAESENLTLEICIGLLTFAHVGFDEAEVVFHARLAFVDPLNHERSLLAHALHDSVEIFHSVSTLLIFIREEIF